MKKQTKRGRGCGVRNTKKNRKKRRQTRKLLKGGSAVMPEQTTITRTPRATPRMPALRSVRVERMKTLPLPYQGNKGRIGYTRPKKKKKETKGGSSREGVFVCAMCENVFAIESPKHGPSGDGFTPRQCFYRQRAQGKHTLCKDCWFDVFVPSEDHRCPGCEKGLDPRPKEIGNWNPKVMVDLTDSP